MGVSHPVEKSKAAQDALRQRSPLVNVQKDGDVS
jgi:hypothetical protein